jgi:hypothetical protein
LVQQYLLSLNGLTLPENRRRELKLAPSACAVLCSLPAKLCGALHSETRQMRDILMTQSRLNLSLNLLCSCFQMTLRRKHLWDIS